MPGTAHGVAHVAASRGGWLLVASLALVLAVYLAAFRLPGRSSNGNATPDCDVRSADIDVERCLAFDPTNVELMRLAAAEALGANDRARAEALYRRALSVDPCDGDVHLRLAQLLLSRGDVASARHEAEASLSYQPGSAVVENFLRALPGGRP